MQLFNYWNYICCIFFIHCFTVWINTHVNNINPGTFKASFHGIKRMNRYTVCPDNFLSLKVFKNIHLFFLFVGPFRVCHAMNLHQIKIIGIKLFPKAINYHISIRSFSFRNTARTNPDFGAQCI